MEQDHQASGDGKEQADHWERMQAFSPSSDPLDPYTATRSPLLTHGARLAYLILFEERWSETSCAWWSPDYEVLMETLHATRNEVSRWLSELHTHQFIRVAVDFDHHEVFHRPLSAEEFEVAWTLRTSDEELPPKSQRDGARLFADRAWRYGASGAVTWKEWRHLLLFYGYLCLACGSQEDIVPDHVLAMSKGGYNSLHNLQPLCATCNNRKGTDHIDFRPPTRFVMDVANMAATGER